MDERTREPLQIRAEDINPRYNWGRPLPALKSLDGDGRVLYAGTFSKVLFPGIRLAYLVVIGGVIVEKNRDDRRLIEMPEGSATQRSLAQS